MTMRFGNNTVTRGPQPAPQAVPPPLARAFVVGRLERGPVGVPTRVSDAGSFTAKFGAGQDANGTLELSQQVQDYFRGVGGLSDVIVLRLYEGDHTVATAKEAAGTGKVTARASGPGKYGDNLQVAYVQGGTEENPTLAVYARELVNGQVMASRTTPAVPVTADGITKANAYLNGLVVLVFNPLGTTPVTTSTAPGDPLSWVALAGGADSPAITDKTLQGSVNEDTQVRTGLELLKDSKWGGGALICPGFESETGRAIKYDWAAQTFRFVPECPATELLISGAVADYQGASLIPNAEFSGYWYPRQRTLQGGQYVTRSTIGALAALYVASIMRRAGYVAPLAGAVAVNDIQHSPDGSAPLVTDTNMASLLGSGLNVLVSRTVIEAQGLNLTSGDPLQPVMTKTHHRAIQNTLAYLLGPVLAQFNNAYVDAQGAFYTAVESELKKTVKPLHDNGVLYGLSLADAVKFEFGFEATPEEALEQLGRVKVNIQYKVSGVAEGIDLSLGQVRINTVF